MFALPLVGTLRELDEEALITILTEPKNALIKQYQKKFEFDNISLKFTDSAIKAIAPRDTIPASEVFRLPSSIFNRMTGSSLSIRFVSTMMSRGLKSVIN